LGYFLEVGEMAGSNSFMKNGVLLHENSDVGGGGVSGDDDDDGIKA